MIEDDEKANIRLAGVVHEVELTEVDDSNTWVAMLEIHPGPAALLTIRDLYAIRDWATYLIDKRTAETA